MTDLKPVVAKNVADLRRAAEMTQAELAERLHYSDKAVSKWERGESLPDIAVLKEIAALFGVTVDWLLEEEHTASELPVPAAQSAPEEEGKGWRGFLRCWTRNHLIITLLSVSLVWLLAMCAHVGGSIAVTGAGRLWLAYIYALPLSAVVLLIFNSIWGMRRGNYFIISVLLWTFLLSLFLTFTVEKMWLVFLLGIPGQCIILLWSRLR